MAGPAVSGEVAWSVPATVRQDRWLSKTEPGLQTRLRFSGFRFGGGRCFCFFIFRIDNSTQICYDNKKPFRGR